MRLGLCISLATCVLALGCPVTETPPLRGVPVGTVVGEVFVTTDGGDVASVAGAEVAIYGTPASATSEAGKQFVLGGVPVGTHTVVIDHPGLGRAARFEVEVSEPFQTVTLREQDTTLGAAATLSGSVNVAGESPVGTIVYLVGGNGRQQAPVGDDGSYLLGGLPRGAAQIAFSKQGFETKLLDVDLTEGENEAETVSLATSSAGDLCFGSSVRLVGTEEAQHQGIAVLLNGGEQVVSTTMGGNYRFCDLSPGLYSVKAQAPGYRSMELPQVALDADGDAHGLVPAYLSPGNDERDLPEAADDRDFTVEIVAPVAGAQFEVGSDVTLSALAQDDGAVLPASAVTWSRQAIVEPLPPATTIGSGDVIVTSDLVVGQHRLRATAVTPDGRSKVAERVVTITPFDYGLSAHIDFVLPSEPERYEGVALRFEGDASVRQGFSVEDSELGWSATPIDDPAATPVVLGSGRVVTSDALDAGTWRVALTVTLDGGVAVASAETVVTVLPVSVTFAPEPTFGAQVGRNVTDLTDSDGEVVGIQFDMFQGEPVQVGLIVDHPLEGDLGARAEWQSDTAFAFRGASPELAELPVGVHTFTVSVVDDAGNSAEWTVVARVQAFAFSAGVIAPRLVGTQPAAQDPPPYFSDFGLPLRATFSHSYQAGFRSTQVRWYRVFDDDNNASTPDVREHVASGLVTRSYALPPGAGVLQLEITDDAGNVATALTQYVLQEVSFSASLVSPQVGTNLLEGESVQASLSYTHNLVGNGISESDLSVRYLSSINGLLTSTTGANEFTVTDQPVFDSLSFGTHTFTASVDDGHGRIAQSRRQLVVRTPGVQAALVTPFDGVVLFPNVTALNLQVNASHDLAVAPLYSWKLDDNELDAGYDDYGSDPSSAARTTLNLGTFTPGSGAFGDSAAWSEGAHVLEFFMRLPEIDAQYGGACVNVPQKAVCIRVSVVVAGADPDVCTGVSVRDVVGPVEVWSGVKRLNCEVQIESGSKLQIQPGTRVIVEPSTAYRLRANGGELVIGDPTGANTDPVVFEVQGSAAGYGKWGGVYLQPATAGTSLLVELHNVVLRHASTAISPYSYGYGGSQHVVRMKNVTIEKASDGMRDFCPDVFENVVFRDIADDAIDEAAAKNCAFERTWSSFTIEGARTGIHLRGAGNVLLDGVTLSGVSEDGVFVDTGYLSGLTVRDSRFSGIGSDANAHAAIEVRGCEPVTVLDSVFADNATGIRKGLTCNDTTLDQTARLVVARSLFTGNTRAIYDESETNRAAEVHLSSFEQNATDLYLLGLSEDVQAQGNFMGAAGDVSSPTGALLASPVGRMPNLPRVYDYRDAPTSVGVIARADNPLSVRPSTVADLPLAYLKEPERSSRYNVVVDGGCVPLEVGAPDAELEVLQPGQTPADPADPSAPDVSCALYLLDDAAAPNGSRTQVGADADGCLSAPLDEGEHALLLECSVTASGRVDQHVVEFLVDNTSFQGRLRRPLTSWSGALTLSGDVIVPAGRQLVIAPDAVISARGADELRYGRYPSVASGIDDAANSGFGKRSLVEIYVDGSLAIGDAAATGRAVLQGDAIVQAKGIWGGLRVWAGGSLDVENAQLTGARTAVHGYMDLDPNTAPDIHLSDVIATDVEVFVQGVCPRTMTGLAVERATQPMKAAFCADSFTLASSTFLSVGNTSSNHRLFELDTYPGVATSLQVLVDGVVVDRGVGTRANTVVHLESSDFTSLIVRDSDFYDVRALYEMDLADTAPAYTVSLEGISVENFQYIHGTLYEEPDSISVDGSLFTNGFTIFETSRQGRQMSFTNNRTLDVEYAFRDMRFSTDFALLTATGNQFENATRVFWFRPEGTSGTDYQPTLTGNNFVGTVDAVMRVDLNSGRTLSADMTGNWWGTADASAIRALITDPQTPTGAPAYEQGRTNFTGYASTALGLSTP